jgi:hypothetical protein
MRTIRNLLLLFIPIIGYSQEPQPSLLEQITSNLPDSAYNYNTYIIENIKESWRLQRNDSLQIADWSGDGAIYTNYNYEKSGNYNLICIDPTNNLYKIGNGGYQLQVKLFGSKRHILVGISINHSTFEGFQQVLSLFYSFSNNTFQYSIDSVYSDCGYCDYCKECLFTFTDSDTVLLIRDYSNIDLIVENDSIEGNPEEELIKLGADPETKLQIDTYIMRKGKLQFIKD